MKWSVLFALLGVFSFGCGDDDSLGDDDDDMDVDAGDDAGDDDDDLVGDDDDDLDAGDEDAAEDAGALPTVEWTIEPEQVDIDHDVGLDYAYPYEVTDANILTDRISIVLCTTLPDEDEDCTELREGEAVSGSQRFGIDPSMYKIGINTYEFTATIKRSGEAVSEDVITLVANVTNCSTCEGGDGS